MTAAEGTPWKTYILLSLCLGTRRSELAALRWAIVAEAKGVVTIAESLSLTRSRVIVKSTKTDRVRFVPLSSAALQAFRAQRALQAQDRLRAGPLYQIRDFVFADPLGEPRYPRSITNAFAWIAAKAGIASARLHDTRHSTATWLLQSGVDVNVASIPGHDAAVLLRTYAHALPDAEARAVENIARRLG